MSLSKEDLDNIRLIVKTEVRSEVSGLKTDVSGLKAGVSSLKTEFANLKTDMDRMEGRLITAINMLQRDSYSRLDDHEARIRRLEQAIKT